MTTITPISDAAQNVPEEAITKYVARLLCRVEGMLQNRETTPSEDVWAALKEMHSLTQATYLAMVVKEEGLERFVR